MVMWYFILICHLANLVFSSRLLFAIGISRFDCNIYNVNFNHRICPRNSTHLISSRHFSEILGKIDSNLLSPKLHADRNLRANKFMINMLVFFLIHPSETELSYQTYSNISIIMELCSQIGLFTYFYFVFIPPLIVWKGVVVKCCMELPTS
ncbi:hypothetical protein BpHYR1_045505 [Brachionus plicatilis]|uniref:Uncharacterized protein n=1 Tax=Brachionus plicatilis TaxID=10195 RepID=A0A3M7QH56_BRAPC|nr:hypothetical protein BpHYR1_045505 [Brachionus plicatilis]